MSLRRLGGVATALALVTSVHAEGVDPSTIPVAVVDGHAISLREVEDALLSKEGSEAFEDWVHEHLQKVDWSKVPDDEVIITIGPNKLTRRALAVALLRPPGGQPPKTGEARDDLIKIALVDEALAKQGLVVDEKALDGAWAVMKRQFEGKQTEAKRLDFASWIKAKEGMEPEEFRQQAGFRKLAGLRLLALAHAAKEVDEPERMDWFDKHHARYDEPEAVQLSVVFMPYRPHRGPDGQDVVDNDDRALLQIDMTTHYMDVLKQRQPFEQVWEVFGKPWDPDLGEGGKAGWVLKDGTREKPGARKLPAELMAAAFKATVFPTLLQPAAGATGVDMGRVEAHRPGKIAAYADVRERVLVDLVEDRLDEWVERVMDQLRRDATIQYRSLPEAVGRRAGDAP
jgi:hypothetical protein